MKIFNFATKPYSKIIFKNFVTKLNSKIKIFKFEGLHRFDGSYCLLTCLQDLIFTRQGYQVKPDVNSGQVLSGPNRKYFTKGSSSEVHRSGQHIQCTVFYYLPTNNPLIHTYLLTIDIQICLVSYHLLFYLLIYKTYLLQDRLLM